MTRKEQLIQAIDRSPDSLIEELWQILQTLPVLSESLPAETSPTILERMGGLPQHFLSNGQLSDRQQRKNAIAQHLQQRHTARQ
jgi:hypothetical protein